MDVSEYRSEISVYVLNPDYTQAQAQTGVISSIGYQAKFFPTVDLFYQACETEPPHFVLIDTEVFLGQSEVICSRVNEISDEILIFLFTSPKNLLNVLQLINDKIGFDYITLPMISSLDLVQKLDRATEFLLTKYENEELKEEIDGEGGTVDSGEFHSALSQDESSKLFDNLFEFLQEIKFIRDKDIIVQRFIEKLSQYLKSVPIIYLKYLPNQMALGLKNSVFVPNANLQGIGIQLKGIAPNLVSRHLESPSEIPQLHNMMNKVFKTDKFFASPFRMDERVLGVFVVLNNIPGEWERKLFFSMLDIMEMAYRSSELELKNHQLEIYDQSTKLLNKKHLLDRMEEEIDRAKRTSHPLSFMLIEIHNERELLEEIGEKAYENLMKNVSKVLRKTNRVNDMIARFQTSLFAVLMPHTPHMGAAVKAEKIRKVFEGLELPILQDTSVKHVHMNFGVTSFPEFCYDVDTIVRTADEAVEKVKNSGGNRVCLASAPIGYTPEYEPIKVEDKFRE